MRRPGLSPRRTRTAKLDRRATPTKSQDRGERRPAEPSLRCRPRRPSAHPPRLRRGGALATLWRGERARQATGWDARRPSGLERGARRTRDGRTPAFGGLPEAIEGTPDHAPALARRVRGHRVLPDTRALVLGAAREGTW